MTKLPALLQAKVQNQPKLVKAKKDRTLTQAQSNFLKENLGDLAKHIQYERRWFKEEVQFLYELSDKADPDTAASFKRLNRLKDAARTLLDFEKKLNSVIRTIK